MADAPHQQITLTVDGVTYKAAFKRHPDVPDYPARLIGPFGQWQESLPLPLDGFLPDKSVEVRFQNYGVAPAYGLPVQYSLPSGYGMEATLDTIRGDGTLVGQSAMARLRNVSGGSDLRRIDGVITEEGDTDNTSGTFRIGTVDTALFEQELPRQKVRDHFANAVLTRGSIKDADPPVYVCCGVSRKVPLIQLNTAGTQWGVVRTPASGTLTWTNVYLNKALLAGGDYSITTATVNGISMQYVTLGYTPNADEQITMHADITSNEFGNTLDFAKFLLSDANFGMTPAQSVNASAFTTESNALDALSYGTEGGLYQRFTAHDLLLQLLVRGTYLSRNTSNEWYPVMDQASAHPASTVPFRMGGAAGPQTIIPDSIVSRRGSASDLTKTLEVAFSFDPGFDGEAKYLGVAKKTVSQLGTVRRWENPFLDQTAAQKECGYALSALRLQDRVLDCDIDLRGQALALGQVVTATIPHRNISGSRMIKALGMGWSGDEASAEISGGYSCTTVPYDASIYSATADSTVLLAGAATVTDYSHTAPGAGTSFAVSSQTSVTANDGTQRTRVVLSVTPPAANRTHIVFAVYPAGSAVSIDRREIEITSGSAHTMSFDLTPGSSVDYQAVMLNHNNVDGKRSSSAVTLTSQTVAGDTSAPSAFSAIAVRKGTGKQVEIEFTGATPSDWSHVDLYRHTSDASGSATVIKSGKKKDFHDDNVSYGSTYYYWGKVVDFTGNASAFSPSSSHSITVTKVGTTDIDDDAVTGPQVDDDAIGGNHIGDAAISSAHIGSAQIGTAHLGDAIITTAKIGDAAITTAKIGSAQVASANIVSVSANTINVAGSVLTVNASSGVTISATGDSAIKISYDVFAKIKWYSGGSLTSETHHIGAGDATLLHGFKGMQLVSADSTSSVRLGTSGGYYTNLGLYFTNAIQSTDSIFDGTAAPPKASTGPDRRIKIVDTNNTALGYIWAEDA